MNISSACAADIFLMLADSREYVKSFLYASLRKVVLLV